MTEIKIEDLELSVSLVARLKKQGNVYLSELAGLTPETLKAAGLTRKQVKELAEVLANYPGGVLHPPQGYTSSIKPGTTLSAETPSWHQGAFSFLYALLGSAPEVAANILKSNPDKRMALHRLIYESKPQEEPYDDMMQRLLPGGLPTEPEAPASDEVSKQRDEAIRIATRLHETVESLIYGLPKYLDDTAQTDEENMIGKAWHVFDAAAYGLAALPKVEPVQDLHELPQSVHEATAEGAGEGRFYRRAAKIIRELGPSMSPGALAATCERLADKEALRARSSALEDYEGEAAGEIAKIIMFGGTTKEVAWVKGKMPPVGTVLYTHPAAPSADDQ